MSTTIDRKVVEMRFDNDQFERNVHNSLDSLTKLKQGLRLDGAARGLDEVAAASRKLDFSGLGSAVDNVRGRFSAMEVVAVTALANIANSAVNAGKNLLKSLAIDPITDGFREYELKMGSVQTIMASTGADLDTVMDKLNELNAYADKTIYSFSDMTSNIGKFTNAGVKLDDAVAAIQGVANVAAVSGANANEASRAMYNFAQALSAGYVKLIDWKSIENANMATVEFKTQLLEAAVAAGTVEKTADGMYRVLTKNNNGQLMEQTIDATHNFNDSLAHQWMTTEVLTETLGHYATDVRDMTDAERKAYEEKLKANGYTAEQIKLIEELGQKAADAAKDVKTFTQLMDTMKEAVGSGWAESGELIIGDFEEAKRLWTRVNNEIGGIIDASSKARNELLRGGLATGWKQLIDDNDIRSATFKEEILSVARAHGIAVDEMIEETGSFEESLKKGWLSAGLMKTALDNIVWKTAFLSDAELEAAGYTRKEAIAFSDMADAVRDGSVNLDAYAKKMAGLSGRENLIESIANSWKFLKSVLAEVRGAFEEVFPPVTSNTIYGLTERLRELTEKFKISEETAAKLRNTFRGVFTVFELLGKGVKAVWKGFQPLAEVLPGVAGDILGVTSSFGGFMDRIRGGAEELSFFESVSERVSKAVGVLAGFLRTFVNDTMVSYAEGGEGLGGVLEVLFDKTADLVRVFGDLASAITGVDFSKPRDAVVGFIQSVRNLAVDFAGTAFDAPAKALSGIKDALKNFQGVDVSSIGALGRKVMQAAVNFAGGALEKIASGVNGALEALRKAFAAFNDVDISGIDSLGGRIRARLGAMISVFNPIKLAFSAVVGFFRKLIPVAGKLLGSVGNVIGSCLKHVAEAFSSVSLDQIISLINSGSLFTIASGFKKLADHFGEAKEKSKGIKEFISGLAEGFGKPLKEISENVSKVLDSARDSLEAWQNSLKADVLLKIGAGVALMVFSLAKLSTIDSDKLGTALGALTAVLGEMMAAFKYFIQTIGKSQIGTVKAASEAMLLMAVSVLVLAGAVKKLADLEWSGLIKGLAGVAAMAFILVKFTTELGKSAWLRQTKEMVAASVGLIILAEALKVLCGAVMKLGALPFEQLVSGLVGLGVVIMELSGFLKSTDFSSFGMESAASMILLSVSLGMLVGTVKKLGKMSFEQLVAGLAGLGVVILELSGFLKSADFASFGMKEAASMVLLGAAMEMLAGVVKKLGKLSFEGLLTGLAGMGGVLAIIAVAMREMPKDLAATSAGLILTGIALNIITPALRSLGKMSFDQVAAGLVMLGGAVAILAYGLNAMGGAIKGAAAMTVGALAIAILVPSLTALGKLGLGKIVVSLIGLAGAFGVLFVAATAMQPVLPSLLMLAGAMALIGVGIGAAGAGVMLFAAGITAIAASGTALVGSIVLIVQMILGLAPTIVKTIGNTIVEIAHVIRDGATSIVEAALAVLMSLAKGILGDLPEFIKTVCVFIESILDILTTYIPTIAEKGVELIMALLVGLSGHIGEITSMAVMIVLAFIRGISEHIGDIVQLAWDIIINFVDGLANSLSENVPRLREAVIHLCEEIFTAILSFFGIGAATAGRIFEVGQEIVGALIRGIKNKISDGIEAAKDLGRTILNALTGKDALDEHSPSKATEKIGKYAVDGLIKGINKKSDSAENAAEGLGAGILDTLGGSLDGFQLMGEDSAGSLLEGMLEKTGDAEDTADALNNGILDTLGGSLGDFESVGEDDVSSLIKGVKSKKPDAKKAADEIGKVMLNALDDYPDKFKELGKDLALGLRDGFVDNRLLIKLAVKGIASDMLNTLRDYRDDFEHVGGYLAEGLEDGIRNGSPQAEEAAGELGDEVLETVRNTWEEHSPSKAAMRLGQFFTSGLSLGISSKAELVAESSRNSAEAAVDAFMGVMDERSGEIQNAMSEATEGGLQLSGDGHIEVSGSGSLSDNSPSSIPSQFDDTVNTVSEALQELSESMRESYNAPVADDSGESVGENIVDAAKSASDILIEAIKKVTDEKWGDDGWEDDLLEAVSAVADSVIKVSATDTSYSVSAIVNGEEVNLAGFRGKKYNAHAEHMDTVGSYTSNVTPLKPKELPARNTGSNSASSSSVSEEPQTGAGVMGWMQEAGNWVKDKWDSISQTAGDALDVIGDAVGGVVNAVEETFSDAVNNVSNFVGGAVNAIGETTREVANNFGNFVGGAVNAIGETTREVANNVGNFVGGVVNAAGEVANNVGNFVGGVVNTIGETASSFVDAVEWTADAYREIVEENRAWASENPRTIRDYLPHTTSLIDNIRTAIFGSERGDTDRRVVDRVKQGVAMNGEAITIRVGEQERKLGELLDRYQAGEITWEQFAKLEAEMAASGAYYAHTLGDMVLDNYNRNYEFFQEMGISLADRLSGRFVDVGGMTMDEMNDMFAELGDRASELSGLIGVPIDAAAGTTTRDIIRELVGQPLTAGLGDELRNAVKDLQKPTRTSANTRNQTDTTSGSTAVAGAQKASGIVGRAKDKIGEVTSNFVESIRSFAGSAASNVANAFRSIAGSGSSGGVLAELKDKINTATSNVSDAVGAIGDGMAWVAETASALHNGTYVDPHAQALADQGLMDESEVQAHGAQASARYNEIMSGFGDSANTVIESLQGLSDALHTVADSGSYDSATRYSAGATSGWSTGETGFASSQLRPVVDHDEAMTGEYYGGLYGDMANIGQQFGSYLTQALAQGNAQMLEERAATREDSLLRASMEQDRSFRDLLEAMNQMRGDFAVMADNMGSLQVVMDSGALVGSIEGPMNTALGRRMVRSRREGV